MSETENNTENTESTQAPAETTAETEAKTFTQADLDKVVADRVSRERRKYEKKYDGVDLDQYQDLVQKAEKERQAQLKAKGDFEKILKEQAEKKDAQINQLMSQVKNIRVDGALLDTASKLKAVNPGQVATLIKDQVKLNETGDVEIVDPKTGQTRYRDDGNHYTIEDLTQEFLTTNPHFVAATPAGSGTTSKVGDVGSSEKLDITKLDMSKPEDRKVYADYRKANSIR
tara:strand:- start:2349 stop:3035 length:687 start_codon:yes stop_codon:yes gene_type:complete